MDIAEVKKKLRKQKKLECTLRASGQLKDCPVLVWDSFFDLSENAEQKIKAKKARYDLDALCDLSREQFKIVIDEYWAFVYAELFQENIIQGRLMYDRDASIRLELPADADEAALKKQFRTLAKIYHPDTDGDPEKSIELMGLYRKLILK